ncbi:hypothetical protein B5808_17090 [Cnuibacter physcomitrellae]|uniref:PucR family transcriptional regulator n=2 Tax=Cnuibacter physcomitrellae TaxID=1619308 RepID=A0A1X9LNP6_9MICO|nr:hypothetical protein B5808_17090 [Cnuibacter physcomitrellae]
MLSEPAFRVVLLTASDRLDDPLSWVSSSDLADPSPFLLPDQFVLTTGLQFQAVSGQGDYDDYVARLAASGVVGIGFGTEVITTGTPPGLLEACRTQGMALVEVPYDVPFVAIITWAAREIAREAAARDEWALSAQQAISLAAVSGGGVSAAMRETARQLEGVVLLYDADGEFVEQHPAGRIADRVVDAAQADVRTLLGRGRRAGASQAVGGREIVVQTLGRGDRPLGAVALVLGAPLDAPGRAVMMTGTSLVEVGRERDAADSAALGALGAHAVRLLARGEAALAASLLSEAARAGAVDIGAVDPSSSVVVLVSAGPAASAASAASAEEVRRRLQRTARTATPTRLAAILDGELVAVASPDGEQWLRRAAEDAVAGLSAPHPIDRFDVAVQEARAALATATSAADRSGETAIVGFADTSAGRLLDVLADSGLPAVARLRLAEVRSTEEGEESVRLAALWFEHGCRWEAAAEAAGMHRHSLRTRVERLAARLDLDLESFPARAELWALLSLS